MAKITLESIQNLAWEHGWTLLSKEYHNLNEILEWNCPEGHLVFRSLKKMRESFLCPTCEENKCRGNAQQVGKAKDVVRILALDDATEKTGWSIFDNDRLVSSGVIEFTQSDTIERISKMRKWLVDMIDIWRPDRVAIEDIQLQKFDANIGVDVFKTLARLQGALLITCFEKDVEYAIVHVSTWRSHCKIKAKTRVDQKRAAQIFVKDAYGVDATQDEADAICIGTYCASKYGKKIELLEWD